MDDFAKALEHYQFQKGQVVRGKVFQYESDGAYVDIGGRSQLSAAMEASATGNRFVCCAALAGRTGLLIIRDQDAEGQVTLSRRQLEIQQIWGTAGNAGE